MAGFRVKTAHVCIIKSVPSSESLAHIANIHPEAVPIPSRGDSQGLRPCKIVKMLHLQAKDSAASWMFRHGSWANAMPEDQVIGRTREQAWSISTC